jgi:nucleotide-binding universal stress UspA family protein
MKIKCVLLPTDLSEFADRAMRQAVELAVQNHARLEIFHVLTLDREDTPHVKEALDDYLDKVEEEVFADLSERTEAIKTRGIEVNVSVARSFSPFEAIMDKIADVGADIVVMGTHGRTGIGKLLMGSVAEKIVRHAPCHVMTLGKGSAVAEGEDGFDCVLAPVDFADYSEKAIEAARELLAPGGKLILVHVVSSPIHPSFYAGGVSSLFQLDPELPGRIGDKLRSMYDGPAEVVVTEGDIVHDILQAAEEHGAELIVMGTRGLSGLDHVLVGSVTERVIRKANVPVLAVK